MPRENPRNYDFAEETATLSDMNAGKDDTADLGAGEVGEIASVEISAPGNGVYSEYERIALGGQPDPQLRTKKSRLDGDLQGDQDNDGTIEDVPASTKLRLRITDKRRSKTFSETRWFDKSELEASNVENLPVLPFPGFKKATFGGDGRVIVAEVRNPSSGVSVSVSDSTLEFPFIGAY